MAKLPVVSGEKMVKIALKLGYEYRRTKGSHVILRNPNGGILVIPLHAALKKGTQHNIMKSLGLDKERLAGFL